MDVNQFLTYLTHIWNKFISLHEMATWSLHFFVNDLTVLPAAPLYSINGMMMNN